MCSIGEDDFGDDGGLHAMQNDFINLNVKAGISDENCKKCNKVKSVVKIDFREAECKECFLTCARHKFRATLGSSKLIPKGGEVLLVVDGAPKSVVLLDMLYVSIYNMDHFKRLRFNAKILYVDDSFINDNDKNSLAEIKAILDNYHNLKSYFITFAATLNQKPLLFEEYQKQDYATERMNCIKFINSIQNLTSKQDFITKTRKNVIRLAAKHLNCQYAFLPDISSDLAATFLTNVSLGYGVSVASDVSLVDNRCSDVGIIRPIKDLTEGEISNYVQLSGLIHLKVVNHHKASNTTNLAASIQNLTRDFISNLQQNFPSTVSTVFRTGDKISSLSFLDGHKSSSLKQCNFCSSNLDCLNSDTLEAIKFSKLVSTKSHNDIETENIKEINLNEFDNLSQNLCHACQNIYQDSSSAQVFGRLINHDSFSTTREMV